MVASKLRTKWCGVASAGFTVLKSNIKWKRVKVGHVVLQ